MKNWLKILLIILAILVILIILFVILLFSGIFSYIQNPPFNNNSAICQNALSNKDYFRNENFTLLNGAPYFATDSLNSTYLDITPDKIPYGPSRDVKKYPSCDNTYCYGENYQMLCKPSINQAIKIKCQYDPGPPNTIGGWHGADIYSCPNEGVYFINYYGDWGKRFVGPVNLATNQFLN